MAEIYGVYKEKTMYGKKRMGIERSTFLIDGQGVLKKIFRKVRVSGHAEEVLKTTAHCILNGTFRVTKIKSRIKAIIPRETPAMATKTAGSDQASLIHPTM